MPAVRTPHTHHVIPEARSSDRSPSHNSVSSQMRAHPIDPHPTTPYHHRCASSFLPVNARIPSTPVVPRPFLTSKSKSLHTQFKLHPPSLESFIRPHLKASSAFT